MNQFHTIIELTASYIFRQCCFHPASPLSLLFHKVAQNHWCRETSRKQWTVIIPILDSVTIIKISGNYLSSSWKRSDGKSSLTKNQPDFSTFFFLKLSLVQQKIFLFLPVLAKLCILGDRQSRFSPRKIVLKVFLMNNLLSVNNP